MDSKTSDQVEFLRRFNEDHVEFYDDILTMLTRHLFILTHSLHTDKIEIAHEPQLLESKLHRFGMANGSFSNLVNGIELPLLGKTFDRFSTMSIVRLQLESFFVIHYLFFEAISDEERSLRLYIFKL